MVEEYAKIVLEITIILGQLKVYQQELIFQAFLVLLDQKLQEITILMDTTPLRINNIVEKQSLQEIRRRTTITAKIFPNRILDGQIALTTSRP